MNTIFAWIALIGGVIGTLVAYKVVPLTILGSADVEAWYDKFGKMFKILGPVAVIVGILLLLW
jgi:hypothetical protein